MMAIQQALLIRKRENRRRKGRRERPGLFTFVFVLASLINLIRFLYFNNPKPTALQQQEPRSRGDGFYAFYKSKSYNITLESLSDLLDSELVHSVINRTNITLEEAARGKKPLMEMLKKAGVVNIDVRVVQLLPTWDEVEKLYGEAPIVEGMSQCHDFRRYHPFHYLGIAGMFDSGTNLASNYLEVNCVVQGRMPAWQVPWGKHVPASQRLTHVANKERDSNKGRNNPKNVMPIVLIRHPFHWMESLCVHNYGAQWHHSAQHCPNLVPNEADFKQFHFVDKTTVPVRITYDYGVEKWDSLAHLWTDWYQQYYSDADFARLIVRYEDFVFFPHQTTQQICDCAGGRLLEPFVYWVESAKYGPGHGDAKTSWVAAMIRYGQRLVVPRNMTPADLKLARQVLDRGLMDAFHYQIPSIKVRIS